MNSSINFLFQFHTVNLQPVTQEVYCADIPHKYRQLNVCIELQRLWFCASETDNKETNSRWLFMAAEWAVAN